MVTKYTKYLCVIYSKWPWNISTFSNLRPSNIYPFWDFCFENKPSGNPGYVSSGTALIFFCSIDIYMSYVEISLRKNWVIQAGITTSQNPVWKWPFSYFFFFRKINVLPLQFYISNGLFLALRFFISLNYIINLIRWCVINYIIKKENFSYRVKILDYYESSIDFMLIKHHFFIM
jgi:hypothetical protein